MNLASYNRFTDELIRKLDADPRVLGLVALGSMAQQDTQPDAWSDHDFFVITIQGVQEDMRQDLSWLPRAEELVFHFRETEHGVKALYRGGHLLEFAIFNEDELQMARLNRYRVLLDKKDIAPRLAELELATRDFLAHGRSNPEKRFAEFLMNLYVGVGRHARGELLSGRQFIKTYALTHLLHLLAEFLPAEEAHLLDNLDPFRRFERVYPATGQELNQILSQDTLTAAENLLLVAALHLRPYLPNFPTDAVAEVQNYIKKAKQEPTS
ncbi:MAG: hypothetical protein H6654_17685 [Ardenticatenaceae bacterium]|nr:hypothetical protein [Anaerolineales bacterium]MCB8937411.1 hypothetical protein [Ardenticatenaceae bacterium]MCB8975395.1 hypothetical protein [Ardenticatenaceae bacterium]